MNEQIRQIARRLAGLRDALDLSTEELAKTCGLKKEEYEALESGTTDIPVSILHCISSAYKVELSTLMFGDEPHMKSYFLTRNGQGASVERTKAYKYQSLGGGFANRNADPFIVTVEPKPAGSAIHLNAHAGQEFNLVLSGKLHLQINGKDLLLNQGDSIYFDATLPHGMMALDEKPVSFLAIIL